MQAALPRTAEGLAAFFCIGAGLVIAAALAPPSSFWVGNFLFFWLPQGGVLALMSMYRPRRPATFAGMAAALAAYLLLFHAWLFSSEHPESMAWLGYLASFPGAVIGGFATLALLARRQVTQALAVGLACALGVMVGIAANQAVVCSTVMHCGSAK
jgi:hypothetical protein